ncbi:hypothetical protein HC864_01105 [Candidatus Gracilibacteria bacterium]|nr:hypothetical protein [Candidatus Gracilibacteria bacterium]
MISDGRDSSRDSFAQTWNDFISKYKNRFEKIQSKIFLGSIGGRFFGMDRDSNFERIDKYLDVITKKSNIVRFEEILNKIDHITFESYQKGVYDEMLTPIGFRGIQKGELVWFLNFRTDRMKQIVKRFCEYNFDKKLECLVLGNNNYGLGLEKEINSDFAGVGYYPIFENSVVKCTLAEYISLNDLNQLHIAETENIIM